MSIFPGMGAILFLICVFISIFFQERDPACPSLGHAFLYFKGFHGIQAYRASNWLWRNGYKSMSSLLQSRISEVFGMDIHPAAQLGSSIMIDHATGVVIGETARVGNGCTLLHAVTLGGNGKQQGDRHPKLGINVSAIFPSVQFLSY